MKASNLKNKIKIVGIGGDGNCGYKVMWLYKTKKRATENFGDDAQSMRVDFIKYFKNKLTNKTYPDEEGMLHNMIYGVWDDFDHEVDPEDLNDYRPVTLPMEFMPYVADYLGQPIVVFSESPAAGGVVNYYPPILSGQKSESFKFDNNHDINQFKHLISLGAEPAVYYYYDDHWQTLANAQSELLSKENLIEILEPLAMLCQEKPKCKELRDKAWDKESYGKDNATYKAALEEFKTQEKKCDELGIELGTQIVNGSNSVVQNSLSPDKIVSKPAAASIKKQPVIQTTLVPQQKTKDNTNKEVTQNDATKEMIKKYTALPQLKLKMHTQHNDNAPLAVLLEVEPNVPPVAPISAANIALKYTQGATTKQKQNDNKDLSCHIINHHAFVASNLDKYSHLPKIKILETSRSASQNCGIVGLLQTLKYYNNPFSLNQEAIALRQKCFKEGILDQSKALSAEEIARVAQGQKLHLLVFVKCGGIQFFDKNTSVINFPSDRKFALETKLQEIVDKDENIAIMHHSGYQAQDKHYTLFANQHNQQLTLKEWLTKYNGVSLFDAFCDYSNHDQGQSSEVARQLTFGKELITCQQLKPNNYQQSQIVAQNTQKFIINANSQSLTSQVITKSRSIKYSDKNNETNNIKKDVVINDYQIACQLQADYKNKYNAEQEQHTQFIQSYTPEQINEQKQLEANCRQQKDSNKKLKVGQRLLNMKPHMQLRQVFNKPAEKTLAIIGKQKGNEVIVKTKAIFGNSKVGSIHKQHNLIKKAHSLSPLVVANPIKIVQKKKVEETKLVSKLPLIVKNYGIKAIKAIKASKQADSLDVKDNLIKQSYAYVNYKKLNVTKVNVKQKAQGNGDPQLNKHKYDLKDGTFLLTNKNQLNVHEISAPSHHKELRQVFNKPAEKTLAIIGKQKGNEVIVKTKAIFGNSKVGSIHKQHNLIKKAHSLSPLVVANPIKIVQKKKVEETKLVSKLPLIVKNYGIKASKASKQADSLYVKDNLIKQSYAYVNYKKFNVTKVNVKQKVQGNGDPQLNKHKYDLKDDTFLDNTNPLNVNEMDLLCNQDESYNALEVGIQGKAD